MSTETREQATGGTCTWLLQLPDGRYVYDPRDMSRLGYSRDDAPLWLSQGAAEAWGAKTPWIAVKRLAQQTLAIGVDHA